MSELLWRRDARRARGRGRPTAECLPVGERGQSTVEYLLVLIAFLASLLAMGALWHTGRDGALLRRAVGASSHTQGAGAVSSLQDISLF